MDKVVQPPTIAITHAVMVSSLGQSLAECRTRILAGETGLQSLERFPDHPGLPSPAFGGWIADRSLLMGRRYGAASNLAVHLAKMLQKESGVDAGDWKEIPLFVGSSRGNSGEIKDAWIKRRPMTKFAASNSLTSEIAAAVSIETTMQAGWHVTSNGCSSGIDALGHAWQTLKAGSAKQAVVLAVDLPLTPFLLADFNKSGLLSTSGLFDPYHPDTNGICPAEGGTALFLEAVEDSSGSMALLHDYRQRADGFHHLDQPGDGGQLSHLLQTLLASPALAHHHVTAVSPHATGTAANRDAESAALQKTFSLSPWNAEYPVTVHCLKPFLGHCLGASGLMETALLADFLSRGELPPNAPHLTPPGKRFPMPATRVPFGARQAVMKWASAMGGQHGAIVLSPP